MFKRIITLCRGQAYEAVEVVAMESVASVSVTIEERLGAAGSGDAGPRSWPG